VDLKNIRIEWMDGPSREYANVTTSVRDGVLHVHQYAAPSSVLVTAEWHFPISNIREWKPVAP